MCSNRKGIVAVVPGEKDVPAAAAAPPTTTPDSLTHDSASRNSLAMLASRLVVAILGWAGSVLIARHLSQTDWGVFSFVFSLLGMMSIVTDLGVGRVVLARLLDSDKDKVDVIASAFVHLRVVLGLVGYCVALGYVLLLGYPAEVVRATAIGGVVVVIATPSFALTVLYQSRLKLITVALAESAAQLLQLVLTVLIALMKPDLLLFFLPAIVFEIFAGIWKLRGIRTGKLGLNLGGNPGVVLWREMLAEAVPLSVGMAMMTLLSKIDVLLLGRLSTFNAVGHYTIAYKFSDLVNTVVLGVVAPATTVMVASWPDLPDQFRNRVKTAAVFLGIITCFVVVGMWASADSIIEFLYGPRFTSAADATRMLLVGAVFAALTHLILMALVSSGRQRLYPWLALGALAINVGLNVVLIPHYSYNGSALATILTEFAMLCAMWILLVRTVPIRRLVPAGKLALIVALTAAVCALSTVVKRMTYLPWPVVAGGSVLAFVAGILLLGLVDRRIVSRFLFGKIGWR